MPKSGCKSNIKLTKPIKNINLRYKYFKGTDLLDLSANIAAT